MSCPREFEFSLIVDGPDRLDEHVEDALFEAGCSDATVSLQFGVLYLEFSRTAASLKDAIVSAIRDVLRANIGATYMRVDECNLVTQAEIARRIKRTRQLVSQYVAGKRGPGGFPAPVCNIVDGVPLWQWCAVSHWLFSNDLIRPETLEDAEVIEAINQALEQHFSSVKSRELIKEIEAAITCP